MFFLHIFLVLALSQDTRAQLAPREVVGLTIEAGGLIGTGVIEFKPPSQERETPPISVTTKSGTPCTSTATCHTNESTTPPSQYVAPVPTSFPSFPVPLPLVPTTGHPGLNSSTRATPTPRPSAPVLSNAVTMRQATCASLVSLVVIEYVFFFF